jgi:hypothetical protein
MNRHITGLSYEAKRIRIQGVVWGDKEERYVQEIYLFIFSRRASVPKQHYFCQGPELVE